MKSNYEYDNRLIWERHMSQYLDQKDIPEYEEVMQRLIKLNQSIDDLPHKEEDDLWGDGFSPWEKKSMKYGLKKLFMQLKDEQNFIRDESYLEELGGRTILDRIKDNWIDSMDDPEKWVKVRFNQDVEDGRLLHGVYSQTH